MYNTYLKIVDAKSAGVQALGRVGRFLDRNMSYMGDAMATFTNIGFNFFLSTTDEDIKEEQTLHSNRNYGSDPTTHTQLAKDAHEHPLNPPSGMWPKESSSFGAQDPTLPKKNSPAMLSINTPSTPKTPEPMRRYE
jgi:hypothetical protein